MSTEFDYHNPYPSLYVHKELTPDLLSVCGLSPYPGHNSSSRIQMFSSHISQKLNIRNPTEKYQQTGMEREFGKYTFRIEAPENCTIIKIIRRFERTMDANSIEYNPQDVVIVQYDGTNTLDIIDVPRYFSAHQYFGFPYVEGPAAAKVHERGTLQKGDVIVDSPAVTANGGYMYGRELNVVFMSHPAVAEDGIMICEDVLDHFAYPTYETRVVEFGAKRTMLNLFGNEKVFKGFPDTGECIGDDGVLMAFRTLDKRLAPAEQSVHAMMTIDNIFDKVIYAKPGGRIVDIRVRCGEDPGSNLLEGQDHQIEKYRKATEVFYSKILNEYRRLKKLNPNMQVTPRFGQFVFDALAIRNEVTNPRIKMLYKRAPLDDYRVEFVIETWNVPHMGSKLTDGYGGNHLRQENE